jgi:L-lactate utilization protein LutC
VELIKVRSLRRALLGRGPVLDTLGLNDRLPPLGILVQGMDDLSPSSCREPFFTADVGITGVDYLVAETGSVALLCWPGEPRALSLLPPVHIAVAERWQLVPDLFDLFAALPVEGGRPRLPSCLSLITGPSKTGDIELRLVTGVHGPGEIHVVLLV